MVAHSGKLNNALAATLTTIDPKARPALYLAPLATLTTQLLQRPYPPFVTGPPGLDTLAYPRFFLGEFLVELGVLSRLDFEFMSFLLLILVVIARVAPQAATVQLQNRGGQLRQKSTVVGDEQYRSIEGKQLLLQPGDGIEIQVVGRLIKQQQVGLSHQRPGQSHTSTPTARERTHLVIGGQSQPSQHHIDTLVERPA